MRIAAFLAAALVLCVLVKIGFQLMLAPVQTAALRPMPNGGAPIQNAPPGTTLVRGVYVRDSDLTNNTQPRYATAPSGGSDGEIAASQNSRIQQSIDRAHAMQNYAEQAKDWRGAPPN